MLYGLRICVFCFVCDLLLVCLIVLCQCICVFCLWLVVRCCRVCLCYLLFCVRVLSWTCVGFVCDVLCGGAYVVLMVCVYLLKNDTVVCL